jgi:hypothetical protein
MLPVVCTNVHTSAGELDADRELKESGAALPDRHYIVIKYVIKIKR